MTLTFAFKDIKGNEARASYTVDILDEPVISNVTPAQGAQTGENKKPTISAEISNAGENASVTMTSTVKRSMLSTQTARSPTPQLPLWRTARSR